MEPGEPASEKTKLDHNLIPHIQIDTLQIKDLTQS